MKLTREQKRKFVNSVMKKLDPVNKELLPEIQEKIVEGMSPLCQELYRQNSEALATDYYFLGFLHNERFVVGDAKGDEIIKPYTERVKAFEDARDKLIKVVDGISTLKQLQDAMPELVEHMPREPKKSEKSPEVVDAMERLAALGVMRAES